MDKILVSFYFPVIDTEYDMLLPINLKISKVIELVQNTIVELTGKAYIKNSKAIILNALGDVINPNNIVKYSGLTNGCKAIFL